MFRYVDQHFHSPETFLENTAELADNADIRERLFEGFRDEIIRIADGEPEEEESEGSIADFFDEDDEALEVDPVTEQRILRDQTIEQILLDVFDSELYDQTFINALASTQQEVIRTAELEEAALLRTKGPISFNMRALYPLIYEQLALDENTAEITTNEVPEGFGEFSIGDRDTTIDALWAIVRNAPNWRGLATVGAILSVIGALAVAERRPSRAIQFGGGIIGLAVVTIVIVFLVRFIVPLLASGGTSSSAVAATYTANIAPLIQIMIRLAILGVILAALGAIARLIWPDDWVYSSVRDERGIRSVKRRRGAPEAKPAQQQAQPQPQAAAVPVAYPPGYGAQQPYPMYPQQWGQPYPGQYPPGYVAPYPAGPYAQPNQQMPQHYQGPGNPTVPVAAVSADGLPMVSGEIEAASATIADVGDDLPSDAAQAVPRVVATNEPASPVAPTPDAAPAAAAHAVPAPDPAPVVVEPASADGAPPSEIQIPKATDLNVTQDVDSDAWASEQDW